MWRVPKGTYEFFTISFDTVEANVHGYHGNEVWAYDSTVNEFVDEVEIKSWLQLSISDLRDSG